MQLYAKEIGSTSAAHTEVARTVNLAVVEAENTQNTPDLQPGSLQHFKVPEWISGNRFMAGIGVEKGEEGAKAKEKRRERERRDLNPE